FLTFSSADQFFNSWSTEGGIRNLGGRLGAQMADLCYMLFGLASYLLPAALLYISYNLLRFKEPRLRFYKVAAFCGLIFSLAALFAFSLESTSFLGQQVPTGGLIGRGAVQFLRGSMNAFGALLVLLPLLAASIMILSGFSFVLFASWWLENLRTQWAARQERSTHAR
ncbi:MAG: DNA translocase FtsK 4TM domain-containing protein, partial [Deltaproteobacteria bacterium]|nr:DNA translocase FtsK 4TM domain-containing protein [Deltaproteobacteria bacterium]